MADRTLNEITSEYGENHTKKKESEAALKKRKDEFYAAANKALEGKVREQRTVEIPHGQEASWYIARWYPGWLIASEDEGIVIIEEDPACMPFVHINDEDGKVYKRSAVPGTPSLDDEALKTEDPELWARITDPDPSIISIFSQFAEWAGGDIVSTMVRQFTSEIPRVLKPMDEINPSDRLKLADYIVPGPIEIKMLAPRAVKPEDLEDEDDD